MSPTFIGEVERGEKSVSFDNLYRLAGALRIPIGVLTDVPSERDRRAMSAEAHRLVALILSVPRGKRRNAYAVVTGVLEGRTVTARRPRRRRKRP